MLTKRIEPAAFSVRSFVQLFIIVVLTAGLSACANVAGIPTTIHSSWIATKNAVLPSSKRKSKAATGPPRYAANTATLLVTFGLQVTGVRPLPADFQPDMTRPPIWLRNGSEVGVIGTRVGRGVMLGFSGRGLSQQRVVIEDNGAAAPGGQLLDVATNADGRTLATAVESDSRARLDVNLSDASNSGSVAPIASLEGEFGSAQLTWINNQEIVLAAQAVAPSNDDPNARTAAVPVSGLYLIKIDSKTSIRRMDGVSCELSALNFSPDGAFAVAQGGNNTPPAIIDVQKGSCTGFGSRFPLQVLAWSPDSSAFLYRTAAQDGVFRFNFKAGRRSIVAIASGAAAFASDGTIIAFGSQELSWRRAVAEPTSPVKAQIALFDPHQNLITINSLGFDLPPALMAESTMVFSQVSNDAIIDTAIPGPTGLVRELIEYSYPARAAFILAHGPVRGPIAISWSPDGRQIAIIDGDTTHRTLGVITPPR
jgi:WD40 repeat protein